MHRLPLYTCMDAFPAYIHAATPTNVAQAMPEHICGAMAVAGVLCLEKGPSPGPPQDLTHGLWLAAHRSDS